MRRGIDGLESRISLVDLMPALLQGDDFAVRWMTGLDEVLAPAMLTMDSLEAYFDPQTAPEDFVEWLGGWVGVTRTEDLDDATRRELVGSITYLHSMRGTIAALSHVLDLLAPARVRRIEDGGGVSWTLNPNEPLKANGVSTLRVTLSGSDDEIERTRALIEAWTPAHVLVSVEVEAA